MSAVPETLTMPSGAVLVLKDAPFEVAMRLLKTVAKELGNVATGLKLDLNFTDPAAINRLIQQDLPLDVLKNAICQIVGSEAIESVFNECLGRCLYDGKVATRESFETRNARQDYLPVAWEVIKHNLTPFFVGLKSKSLTAGGPTGDSRK